jgi:hypothetical protein
VNSNWFYQNGLNGKKIQTCTYFGRYLSFSAIYHETKTWKNSELNVKFHQLKPKIQ